MGKNNKGPQPKKAAAKNTKKADAEFDAFLKELTVATAEGAKDRKHIATQEERRQMHKEKREEEEQKRKAEQGNALLQHRKQMQLQRLIQELMRSPFGTKPNTEFAYEAAESDDYKACCGWMQGWRSNMEDAHIVLPSFNKADKAGLFAVFDGHGGAKCAELCQELLPASCSKHYKSSTKSIDFEAMYPEVDATLKTKLDTSGATAVTVLVTDEKVSCASVGDSRAVLCRADGSSVDLSDDHKPENEAEGARIVAAGGHVANNRVNGELAMSRALGDFQYKGNASLAVDKQLVIPNPDVVTVNREKGDKFVVVACDGIFDVLSNQEVVDFVAKELETTQSLDEICKKVCLHCLAPEGPSGPTRAAGTDNMTITIVLFK